jgi:DNA-binding winged helix-turn-helix (wHTH) protein
MQEHIEITAAGRLFRLDLKAKHLYLEKHTKVPLTRQQWNILEYFLNHVGELISKDALIENVWRGNSVTDDAITRAISSLRKALGDEPDDPHFIETSIGFGYRFIAQVSFLELTQPGNIGVEEADEQPAEACDPDVFPHVVREGLLLTLGGEFFLPSTLLSKISQQCRGPKLIAEMISPDQDLHANESLVGKLLAFLLLPNLRTQTWGEEDLNRVLSEAGRHVHGILLRKASAIGLFVKCNDKYVVDDGALDSVVYNLSGRFSTAPTASQICREIYESWRELITGAVEREPGQNEVYISILSLFMYCIAYDNGSVKHCIETCSEW